jgi:hypothetical protein
MQINWPAQGLSDKVMTSKRAGERRQIGPASSICKKRHFACSD